MYVNPNVKFRLSLGQSVFRCQDKMFGEKDGIKEIPYVIKNPEDGDANDMSKWEYFKAFLNSSDKIQFIQTYLQSINRSCQLGTDNIQFILTKEGLEIGKYFNTREKVGDDLVQKYTKLCCNKKPIE